MGFPGEKEIDLIKRLNKTGYLSNITNIELGRAIITIVDRLTIVEKGDHTSEAEKQFNESLLLFANTTAKLEEKEKELEKAYKMISEISEEFEWVANHVFAIAVGHETDPVKINWYDTDGNNHETTGSGTQSWADGLRNVIKKAKGMDQ